MKHDRRALVALLLIATTSGALAETRAPYLQRAEVQQFIDDLTAQHGLRQRTPKAWFSPPLFPRRGALHATAYRVRPAQLA